MPNALIFHIRIAAAFARQQFYTYPASHTLAIIPANVAKSAPVSVYLVFFTFAAIK